MAMRQFFSQAAGALRVRCAAPGHPALSYAAVRSFSTVLQELKYAKSHEWVKVEGDVATIGITDHAQSELGDVVHAEVNPKVGDAIEFDTAFAVVESVKAASDVMAPVSGTILELNAELAETPSLVNDSPFEKGWFAKVKLTKPSELNELLDAKAYEEHVEASAH